MLVIMLPRPVELHAPAPSLIVVCARAPSPEFITSLPLASFQTNPEICAFIGSTGVGEIGTGVTVGGLFVLVAVGFWVASIAVDCGTGVAEAATISSGANVAVMSKISGVPIPITTASLQVNCAGMPKSDTDTK